MTAYLDASVALPALVSEATSERVDRYITSLLEPIAISEFAAAEIISGLSRQHRMGELPDVTPILLALSSLRRVALAPDIVGDDFRRATELVSRFDLKLRAPDALHLAVCERRRFRLVTLDLRLADAAAAVGADVHVP
jgi:uncharacterized protein